MYGLELAISQGQKVAVEVDVNVWVRIGDIQGHSIGQGQSLGQATFKIKRSLSRFRSRSGLGLRTKVKGLVVLAISKVIRSL